MERNRTSTPIVTRSAPAFGGGLLQRKCACGQHAAGGECEECKRKKEENKPRVGRVQAKLALGSPGDPLELEADRIADLVVGGGLRASREPVGPARGNDRGGTLRRKPGPIHVPDSAGIVPPGSGRPLDEGARVFMESRFGHDFSHVRIHTDSRAAESARSFGALAYTLGENIVFGTGRYSPATTSGSSPAPPPPEPRRLSRFNRFRRRGSRRRRGIPAVRARARLFRTPPKSRRTSSAGRRRRSRPS
jgi:hypothetical protein